MQKRSTSTVSVKEHAEFVERGTATFFAGADAERPKQREVLDSVTVERLLEVLRKKKPWQAQAA